MVTLMVLMANVVNAASDEVKVVPVYEEPRHRLVFANEDMMIINVSVPPGDTTLYHTHSHPTAYVVFTAARVRLQTLGEDWVELDPEQAPKAGDIIYREDYLKTPLTHRAENLDEIPFQVLGVINRGRGNKSSPESRVDNAPEPESPWFRVYRFDLAGGRGTDVHHHAHPVVVVQVNDGKSVVIENDWPTAEKTVGGTWSWHRGGIEHSLVNSGEAEVELIEIEVIK